MPFDNKKAKAIGFKVKRLTNYIISTLQVAFDSLNSNLQT